MRYPDDLHYLDLDTTRVAYLDPKQGRPMLMLHGFTFNAWSFRHQIDMLVKAGFRPIVPDNPAFGHTPMTEQFGGRAEDYCALHCALLDALDIEGPIPVVGHSLGGGMALFLAWQHPHRVSTLVAIAPASEPSHKAVRVARVAEREGFDEVAPIFFTPERLVDIARSAYGDHPPQDDVIDLFVEGVDVLEAFGVVRTFFSPKFFSMPEHYSQISAPTLIVAGDEDPHNPMGLSERPAREIPGARLELLPGLAHCPHEESPSVFNPVLLSALTLSPKF